ncbi:MAG: metal-dependent transcriptional regulator [Candidatus Thermoplasmatota archaeon]|nr:metal-dependent transcriptional regulator [Candidatus Thermoplasmatota archaeon]
MNKETREEYLETLYKLSLKADGKKIKTGEIAEELGVKPPTVTEVLPRLEEEGCLEYRPYQGVKLTGKGLTEGKRIVRTHRVIEVFLDEYFSISGQTLHEKACEMEHIFDLEMINEMCERLGAPEECPHGNEIPPCDIEICPVEGDRD